jgi:hypothetical protein
MTVIIVPLKINQSGEMKNNMILIHENYKIINSSMFTSVKSHYLGSIVIEEIILLFSYTTPQRQEILSNNQGTPLDYQKDSINRKIINSYTKL